MQQRQLMHHNIENKCADHKLTAVDIHLLIERDYSLVQAQLASQENQQGSLHSPLLETITKSKLRHKLTKPL